ncbi:MAG: hypothetical protein ACE5IZ_09385 [Dehalococcoidia bacterium]
MANFAMEVCDGTPSFAGESLDEFVENVQRYCPWSAVPVDLQDLR